MEPLRKDDLCSEDRRGQYYKDRIKHNSQRYPEYNPASVELVLSLIHTYDLLETFMARWLGQSGISISGFNVMMILNDAGDAGSQLNQLGELLLVSRANITGIVDSLEQRGLVERAADKNDRRVRIARITESGKNLLASILPSHYRVLRELSIGLGEEEKAALVKLLSKLRTSFQQADCWKIRDAHTLIKEGTIDERT